MGAGAWHRARADRHKEVADFLSGQREDYTDWAAVALFYAAMMHVHAVLSTDPTLRKDERHPRKHTAPPGAGSGGRGTNQLVAALFPSHVNLAYRSLFEASHRTRYDFQQLGPGTYKLLEMQYREVETYCKAVAKSRSDIPTSAP